MKTTSFIVFVLFFLSSQAFGAVKTAPNLAEDGIFAAFGAAPHYSSVIRASEETHMMRFGYMSDEIAGRLGISKSEMESYNRELDQLNAMMLEVSHELSAMKTPTLDDAAGLWTGLKGAVSSTTLEAIRKITQGK
jgi:hypothetical protein